MLKKERQKKRFKAIGKAMYGHLTAFFELQNPEGLHHFRIQVKKMKALLFFLHNGVLEKHETKHLQLVQHIFKHAGRIRTAHLNIGLLTQSPLADLSYKIEQENIKKSNWLA
jgi:CHAD domain-containing protein